MPVASTTDHVDIHYDVGGSGPPIVLVHGITDSSADWGPIDERLAVDHTVVSLDLRGHGRSGDSDDYSPLGMAHDVEAVVDASGIEPPLVVGHSLGAVVATAYAAGAPTRGVVSIDQTLRFSDSAATIRQLEHQLRGSGFHAALHALFRHLDGPLVPDSLRSRLATNRDTARPEVVLGVWELTFSTSDEDLDGLAAMVAPGVTVPHLSIFGNDPGDDYATWLTGLIPQAQVELWDGLGHYPHLVDPDRFVDRLARFETASAGPPS
ncbi:MAG: alpha/beta fold hydrolase [Acidimicrobiales bacterium]